MEDSRRLNTQAFAAAWEPQKLTWDHRVSPSLPDLGYSPNEYVRSFEVVMFIGQMFLCALCHDNLPIFIIWAHRTSATHARNTAILTVPVYDTTEDLCDV